MITKIIIIVFIFSYVKYVLDYVSYSLLIEPSKPSAYIYTLGEITVANNICHTYILVSSVVGILCFYVTIYLNNIIINLKFLSFNKTKRNFMLFIRSILLVTLSLCYYTILICTLWMFIHYIPGGYIVLSRSI